MTQVIIAKTQQRRFPTGQGFQRKVLAQCKVPNHKQAGNEQEDQSTYDIFRLAARIHRDSIRFGLRDERFVVAAD